MDNTQRNKLTIIWEWVTAIIVALLIAFFIKQFMFAFFQVSGDSMIPTFINGERVLVDKIPYYFHEPNYGDVIIFHATPTEDYIKRVIGKPGDEIEIKNGNLYRNGQKLSEPYIKEPMNPRQIFKIKVPSDELFVMGDNRNNSKDSREIGPIELHQVIGRVDLVVFPFNKFKFV
jgi:signal peptidase I